MQGEALKSTHDEGLNAETAEAALFLVKSAMKDSMWKRLEPLVPCENRDERIELDIAETVWLFVKSAMAELIEERLKLVVSE